MTTRSLGASSANGAGDDALLERIRRGDAGAFGELFDRHWRPLVRYALRVRGTEDEAEEAAQAAFIRLWEKREEWTNTGSVRGLLFRITRDTALNARLFDLRRTARHEAFHRRASTRSETPDEGAECAELESAFRRALAQLSERRREVFNLTRVDGLTYREAADVLGIAPKTAANHLTSALSELHDALKDYLEPKAPPIGRRPTSG